MSRKISFEDVQTAATDLVQCATNVLSVRYLLENFKSYE
jgi:hypothetical protein